MARKADVTYRSTPLTGAVFEVGTVTLVVAKDGASGTLTFPVFTWLSEAAFNAASEPNVVPEWSHNEVAWDPDGSDPVTQAYAYVVAKLTASGATNISTV